MPRRILKISLRTCSIPIILNRNIYQVVGPLIHRIIFVPLSYHLHSSLIAIHLIVSILFLLRQIQTILIIQKNLVFVLYVTLHRISIRKWNCILQVHALRNQIQMILQATIPFSSTTSMLNIPMFKEYTLPGGLTSSIIINLHNVAFFSSEWNT